MHAYLALADGSVWEGVPFGATGEAAGELCFNTSMTGYQEILTDPSYAEQIIVFTYPHIGNVGVNAADEESDAVYAKGLVVRAPRPASNWRSEDELARWLAARGVVGIAEVDTRALVRRLREQGAMGAGIVAGEDATPERALALARGFAGLAGRDLVRTVTRKAPETWREGPFDLARGAFAKPPVPRARVVAYDFGCKRNILRLLAAQGLEVVVVPATTSADEVLALAPDGVFLSNGPGDPAPVRYAVQAVRRILDTGIPVFGICMGHQILAQALGARTYKLKFGHRGGNHPVKELATGRVKITSQNHGFAVDADSLAAHAEITEISLFDGSVEGLALRDRPVFSVQYHPEASPGPHDAEDLFRRFADLVVQTRTPA